MVNNAEPHIDIYRVTLPFSEEPRIHNITAIKKQDTFQKMKLNTYSTS